MNPELRIQKPKAKKIPFITLLLITCSIIGCGGGGEGINWKSGEGTTVVGPPAQDAPKIYSVTLAWDAPITNVDGSPLTDLAGYKIYYGTSPGNFTTEKNIGNVTTYTVPDLAYGTYYFAVKAYDTGGNHSEYSSPNYGLCVNVSATPTVCPK